MGSSSLLLERAVDQLATLPGVGRRTAMRLALDLLRRESHEVVRFSEAIRRMREEIRYCSVCCNICDDDRCSICSSPQRDQSLVCVVEDLRDVVAIENTRQYKGLYHVLGGLINPMEGIGPEQLHIPQLITRVEQGGVREVILALEATVEGDTTGYFLHKRMLGSGVSVSLIARGISLGGELEQVDEMTLGRSILDRKPYEQSLAR